MATGYTADVADGKVTDFETFALQCARNFGALIEMRDEPMDAPIPGRFEPSTYHVKALKEAQDKLAVLLALTPDKVEQRAAEDFSTAMSAWEDDKRAREEKRHRYQSMLDKVKAWPLPTLDHQGLKDFMVQQLSESIRFDCDDDGGSIPKRLTAKQWLKERLERARRDVEYHRDHDFEERKRTKERNEWVNDLRRSLREAVTR